MAEQSGGGAPQEPNHASEMEQAEGSREHAAGSRRDTGNPRDDAQGGTAQPAAGITNRPLEREQEEQDQVPPRGTRKDEGSHA